MFLLPYIEPELSNTMAIALESSFLAARTPGGAKTRQETSKRNANAMLNTLFTKYPLPFYNKFALSKGWASGISLPKIKKQQNAYYPQLVIS
jgi:hypothetical protein